VSSRGGSIALALGAAVLLVLASGATGSGGENRIAFASRLAGYPPPPNLNVAHLFSIRAIGGDRQDLGPDSRQWQDAVADRGTVARLRGGELWLENADGSGQRLLLPPPSGQQFASYEWSPDGKRLAVSSEKEIWVTNLDGSQQRRLLAAAADASWESVDWSPDSGRLAVGSISFAGCTPQRLKWCAQWLVDIVGVGGNHVRTIADARHPAWSPNGTRIVLEQGEFAHPDQDSRITVRRADGSAPRLISDTCADCSGCWSYPTWSPDGKRISYIGDDCDETFVPGPVVIVQSKGPLRQRVIPNVLSPAWSPDGSRFLYFRGCTNDRNGNTVNCNLFSASADGTHPRRLVGAEPFAGATWSPDGRRLALVFASDGQSHGQIFSVNAAGGGRRQLTHEPAGSMPTPLGWTPDGRRLLYSSLVTQTDGFEIWTMRPDGGDLKQVTSNATDDVQPAWSPDHSRIAFVRWSAPRKGGAQTAAIYTVNADGSGEKLMAGGPRETDTAPAWSPDGSRLAFVRASTGAVTLPGDIFLVNVDGSNLRRLTTTSGRAYAPAWSPDGSEIAFSGDGAIDLIHPDGTSSRTLTSSPAGYGDPAWSPDGTRLAVTSQAGISLVDYSDGAVQLLAADRAARSPSWSPDGSRITYSGGKSTETCVYWAETTTCPQSTVFVVDAAGGTPVDLTPFPGVESSDPTWFVGLPR
jgi:Tol biopolymer transport system component